MVDQLNQESHCRVLQASHDGETRYFNAGTPEAKQ